MLMPRRSFVLTLVFATLVSVTSVSAQKPEVGEVDAWLVRDANLSAQFAVADQMGFFKEQGLKVNLRWYVNGADLPSMWGAGNIDLGTTTTNGTLPIAAAGQSIYIVAPQSDVAGTQQVVIGKRAQEILHSPKDFEKLKVGMPKGSSITMAIQNFARDAGVDFNKIQFVNLAPPDSVTALAKGDIDAMAGWAPWVFNAVKQAGGKMYFSGNKSNVPGKEGPVDWLLIHSVVVASGKMIKEHPNALRVVLRGLEKATAAITTDRNAAVKVVAREIKVDEALTREIMSLNAYSMEVNDKPLRSVSSFNDFLLGLNRIPRKVEPESVFYTKALKDVNPALVKWEARTDVR